LHEREIVNSNMEKCAIAGIGETAVGKLPEMTSLAIQLEAIRLAIKDAGLRSGDIDGVLAIQPADDPRRSYALSVAQAAGICPSYATDLAVGGATPVSMVAHAVMAISAGLCSTVVCVLGHKQATGRLGPRRGRLRDGLEDFEEPFGVLGAPAIHGAVAARHMYEFGTTNEQLAAVAVAARRHASLNASATMRQPITVADVLASRWIVKPFHLLDCCLVSDGGGAVVVTSSERARDLKNAPIYIRGFGEGHTRGPLESDTLTTLGGKHASDVAYKMAGVGPRDIDFAELYDCFTAITIVTLEDYGFCAKGEGGPWVENGRIEVGGELPVNTHGGLLSHGHIEGMLHITEAVKQLRGGSVEPERQVAGARLGIVSGHGANLSAHATLILGRDP
jgi:acetyl-CoA acetyltransferase